MPARQKTQNLTFDHVLSFVLSAGNTEVYLNFFSKQLSATAKIVVDLFEPENWRNC